MITRWRVFTIAAAVASAATLFGTTPAFATGGCTSSCTASTSVTFTVSGGGLTISVPSNPTATLTAGTIQVGGETATGSLNATTVSDMRGLASATWTVTADANSGFTGSATATNIPDSAGAIDLGVASLGSLTTTGGMVPTSGALTYTAFNSTTPPTLVSGTTAISGTLTYTPSVQVTIPASAPADTYTGAVVQTVS